MSIRRSIQKTKVVKEPLAEDKYKNNENEINTQNEDVNDKDSYLVKTKDKTQAIGSTEDIKKVKIKSRRIRSTISFSRTVCKITTLV